MGPRAEGAVGFNGRLFSRRCRRPRAGRAAPEAFPQGRRLSPLRDTERGPAGLGGAANPVPVASPVGGRSHRRPALPSPPQARQPRRRGQGRPSLGTEPGWRLRAPLSPRPRSRPGTRRARLSRASGRVLAARRPDGCRPRLPAEHRGGRHGQQPRPLAGGSLPAPAAARRPAGDPLPGQREAAEVGREAAPAAAT